MSERRESRQVFYHLQKPELAAWLSEAMRFIELETVEAEQLREAIKRTRSDWVSP